MAAPVPCGLRAGQLPHPWPPPGAPGHHRPTSPSFPPPELLSPRRRRAPSFPPSARRRDRRREQPGHRRPTSPSFPPPDLLSPYWRCSPPSLHRFAGAAAPPALLRLRSLLATGTTVPPSLPRSSSYFLCSVHTLSLSNHSYPTEDFLTAGGARLFSLSPPRWRFSHVDDLSYLLAWCTVYALTIHCLCLRCLRFMLLLSLFFSPTVLPAIWCSCLCHRLLFACPSCFWYFVLLSVLCASPDICVGVRLCAFCVAWPMTTRDNVFFVCWLCPHTALCCFLYFFLTVVFLLAVALTILTHAFSSLLYACI
ncbi:uncharacterized protein LOC107304664 [Oryza brachyantha]|uniref:Uncharacterized protein n=1 Tax=Oryza brachyantha TaxID=4533 RepID=J3MKF3_ORYBR|nr:uncharacterized protein LOC107304664 [Oryza brachyantha]XP_015695143.1 uncharacterized protein LOC107304664 [Oryza brachyantha]